jgi:hypothetical protein
MSAETLEPIADSETPAEERVEIDYLGLSREAYRTSTDFFDSGVRNQIEADIRQFNSQHPTGSKYLSDAYKARSKFFRPKTRGSIRKSEAIAAEAFFSGDDVVSVEPQNDEDPRGMASAEAYKFIMQYRLKKTIPWFQTVVGAYQETMAVGVVASIQEWLFDRRLGIDKPSVKLVPVENLRFDPAAEWYDPLGTSPYIIHLMPMYVKDVRAKMDVGVWEPASDSEILTAIKAQGDSIRLAREHPRQDSKEQTGVTAFTIVWVHRNIMNVDGIDVCFHTLGTQKMLDDPEPVATYDGWMGERPYVMGCCVIEAHKVYPAGVSRLTKETQGEINQVANARIDNWMYALNRRYFIKRNSQVDTRSLQRNSPGGMTMMNDPEKDVKVLDTQDVTASASAEQDRLNLDFDDLSGSFSSSSVQSNRKLNETATGMNILTTNANQISGYQLRTFVETWAQPVLRQIQRLEACYETDPMILALAGQKAAELLYKCGESGLTDELLSKEMVVDINVGMGATNPHQQVDNFLSGMKALKDIAGDGVLEQRGLDFEAVSKELFSKLGYRSGARFFKWKDGGDPKTMMLQNQITSLQSALDAKYPPEIIAKAVAETKLNDAKMVETINRAIFAALQTAEVITAVPQTAPIADEIMKAAGYQPPVPAGVDPNFPQPAGAGTLTVNPVKNRLGGTEFTPGAAGDTSPQTPATPATPGVGANQGINTMRPDSAP